MKQSKNLTTGAMGTAVRDAIRTGYNIVALPRLTADWNWNRYTTPTAVNTPLDDDEGFDVETFPIESIVEPLRPTKGVAKARVNESVVSGGYVSVKAPKFYVADTEDVYKYWTSPYPTNASGVFPNHTDGETTARPRVNYNKVTKTNKIVIKFENTWATPKTYNVKIATTVGGALGSAIGGTNPAIDGATGTLTLYYNGTAWVSNKPATLVTTNVASIQLSVSAMGPGIKRDGTTMFYRKRGSRTNVNTTGAKSSLNVISIEAHLEADLTDRLISTSDDFDMAEISQLYPIGTITTNQGNLTLSNEDGAFNRENASSPYAGLIEPNAEFNLEYIYNIGGTLHSVQQFKMYASGWSNSDDATTSVELEDYSKYLKETKPNPWMIENKTSTEIVWRVLDSVGFVDYEIQMDDLAEEHIIPVFWTTGEMTAWEVLDEVARATQTAIYFDSYGKLQVKTRSAAFRDTASVDWNIMGKTVGNNLADLFSWSPSSEYEANKIDVTYKSTKWKVNSLGKPAMSKVWEPDGQTLALRSSPLVRSMTATDTVMYLDQKEIAIWPYKGKVQIDGEIISYEGKKFIYYTGPNGGVKNVVTVTSEDAKRKYHRLTPDDYKFKNMFNGGLVITERGTWNSDRRAHSVDVAGWVTKSENAGKGIAFQQNGTRGFTHNRVDSTVTINTPPGLKHVDDTFWAFRGLSGATGYTAYGTRMKFNYEKASPHQIAGMAIQLNNGREFGYYVDIRPSGSISAAQRKTANEVSIVSKTSSGNKVIAQGAPIAIAPGVWYDVDIFKSGSGNSQRISVWINGQMIASASTTAATAHPDGGRFGFFARGQSNVTFEFVYALSRPAKEPLDDYGFYDLKYGGIRGGQWEREYVWETRTRWKKIRKKKWVKETYRHNRYIFDEFGPYVHEIREFDIKFDPAPVKYSYLFSTNEWYAASLEYNSNPFGAKFILANTGRDHAVLHGEDNLVYAGAGAAVNQVCVVLGQNLEIADDAVVTRKNISAIRSRGEIPVELSSPWIQSKAMADELALWMARHWSTGVDQVEVEIFGNPLIEIGDIVDVNYPAENATPATHKYFVVGAKNSFDSGISTTLVLRRVRVVASDKLT